MPFVRDAEAIARPGVDLDALTAAAGLGPRRETLVGDPGLRAVLVVWPPGYRTVPHLHPGGTELFLVRSGRLVFRLADQPEREAGPGAFLVARPYELHGLRVMGDEPLSLVAIVGPNEDRPDEQLEDPGAWPDWALP